jgi:hypothetical protein
MNQRLRVFSPAGKFFQLKLKTHPGEVNVTVVVRPGM